MSKRARILVLLYTEISLVYVIIAFADVTAGAFVQVGTELDPDDQVGAKAGSSSCMYLAVGLAMGIVMKLLPKAKLWMLTPPFLILVIGTIVAGEYAPLPLNQRTWDMLLLSYCWFAAIAPAWLLLQPRGYLGGFFLYTTLVGICLGITVSLFTSDVGFPIEFPAWRGYGEPPMQLFPVLFITVACGACSGFHAVVSSGTTAKQLSRERDALPVSYGAMLLESFVAVLSCSTIMIMSEDDPLIQKADAQACYARGVSSYLYVIGKPLHIPLSLLYNFAMMAFATFVCDTLDVATRLGRIVLQELIPWKPKTRVTQAIWHLCCTTSVLVLPFLILGFSPTMVDPKTGAIIPLWRSMWGLFGSCNQLFAALVLLIGSAWLASKGKKWALSGIPMLIMFTVATVALIETSVSWIQGFSTAGAAGHLVGVCSTLMLILCAFFVFEACASLGTYVLPSYVLRKLSSFRDSMLAKFHKLKEDPEDVIGAPMDQLSS
ncbi:carbon starvation protein A [Pelomyxa schiedti]|nr:carbon starvation protein A [Pelomyxa schiedti]